MTKSRFEISVEKIKQKYDNLRKGLTAPKIDIVNRRAPENNNPCVRSLKHTSQRIFGISSRWLELYDILEQQRFICPYSGVLLQIGENASVDHIISKATGGKDEITNLQWVDIKINYMKRDHTPDEFLALVKRIAIHTKIFP